MATAAQRHARRVRLNRMAHGQGLTRRGYDYVRAGGDRDLAERTQRSIRKQAQREIGTAYEPVEKEFSRREAEVRALDQKRATDEAAFAEWVKAEQARIVGDANQRFLSLVNADKEHRANLEKHLGIVQAQTPGAGGAQFQVGSDVSELAKSILNRESIAATAGNARGRIGGDLLSGIATNNLGVLANMATKRGADLQEVLSKISESRGQAAAQRAGDYAKRLAGLGETELTKAQARQAALITAGKEAQDWRETTERTRTTRRGQTLSSRDRALDRASREEQAALDREAQRAADKAKNKNKGKIITPKSRAAATQKYSEALLWLRDKGGPDGKRRRGRGQTIVKNMRKANFPYEIAVWAVYSYLYPGAKLTKQVAQARRAALLSGGK